MCDGVISAISSKQTLFSCFLFFCNIKQMDKYGYRLEHLHLVTFALKQVQIQSRGRYMHAPIIVFTQFLSCILLLESTAGAPPQKHEKR